jgi:hypothetical protein
MVIALLYDPGGFTDCLGFNLALCLRSGPGIKNEFAQIEIYGTAPHLHNEMNLFCRRDPN